MSHIGGQVIKNRNKLKRLKQDFPTTINESEKIESAQSTLDKLEGSYATIIEISKDAVKAKKGASETQYLKTALETIKHDDFPVKIHIHKG